MVVHSEFNLLLSFTFKHVSSDYISTRLIMYNNKINVKPIAKSVYWLYTTKLLIQWLQYPCRIDAKLMFTFVCLFKLYFANLEFGSERNLFVFTICYFM